MSQTASSFRREIRKTVSCKYLLSLPEGEPIEKGRRPLLLFLHGAGERGDDLNLVTKHGPHKILAQRPDFPFILVSPQCPPQRWWDTEMLNHLLDEVIAKHDADTTRVYVTGLSMGGFGTWGLAIEYPERFAAIAPICGGGSPYLADRLRKVPVWAFHGGKDEIVPVIESQRMVDAVRKAGGDARITLYPEAGHDCWTETYNNPALYSWLLSHRRG